MRLFSAAGISAQRAGIPVSRDYFFSYKRKFKKVPVCRDKIASTARAPNLFTSHSSHSHVFSTKMAEAQPQKEKRRPFRWNSRLMSELVDLLLDYKTTCEYRNVDFEADRTVQYQHLRKKMAQKYNLDENFFGPEEEAISPLPIKEMTEEQKTDFEKNQKIERQQIKQGDNRIQEKVKDMRQAFSKAICAGTRSDSGKLVYDHYDTLKLIWGGAPSSRPLTCGIDSYQVNSMAMTDDEFQHEQSSTSRQPGESERKDADNKLLMMEPKAVALMKVYVICQRQCQLFPN